MDVSEEELQQAMHEKGPKCRCSACSRLKDIEDQWILKMGTFYGESGLNERAQRLDSTGKNKLKEGGIRVCYPGYPSLKGQGRIYVRSNIYLGGVAIPP